MMQRFRIRWLERVGTVVLPLTAILIALTNINTAFAIPPSLPPAENPQSSGPGPQTPQAASVNGQSAPKDATPATGLSLRGTESHRAPASHENVEPINLPARIFQVAIGLAIVLAAIFGASWFVKRFGRFPSIPTSKLRVLASLSVGQRERIVLLQVGDEQLLLGVTSQAVQVLHKLDEPLPTAAPTQRKEPMWSFSRRLQDELNDRVVP